MSLTAGTKLGPYGILAPLGAGGMGEVYRARDSRLDRDVAIKVLPEAFSRDPERVARFEREAKLLASLNHPNIAAVYGFEQAGDKRLLVLELVEGETLADRLKVGPMAIDEALATAKQIAEALESAHEQGIIHRDLKPGNIKITPEGKVKVLDFGLAKAMAADDRSHTAVANSPTITADFTRPGVIMGTAAYMSPEQARGKAVDKRTDIWSFGCVLYECLGGRKPFDGETSTDLIARILERDPDWSRLPPKTPPTAQLLMRRCLAKDRNKRLRDIGDARIELESALADPTSSGLLFAGAVVAGRSGRRGRGVGLLMGLLVATALLGSGLGWWLRASRESVSAPAIVRFNVDAPAPFEFRIGERYDSSSFCLDDDGTMLAFSAFAEGSSRIFVRKFSENEARALPGTEGGWNPFFSPDGRWVGYFMGGKLMKAPVSGGPAMTLCDATATNAAWLEDGTIVYGDSGGRRLLRVGEMGGMPKELAIAGQSRRSVDGKQLLLGFQSVCAIPAADYVLAGVWDGTTIEDYAIVSVSLADGTVRSLMQHGVDPKFIAPGTLVFLRGSSVMEVPFDAKTASLTGEPREVIGGVVCSKWADDALFTASANGTLAFMPGGRQGPDRRLIRVDSTGKSEPLTETADAIVGGMRLSPDGRDLILITLRRNIDLWSFNLARRSLTLVNNMGESWSPVWTPDGSAILFGQIVPEKPRTVVKKRVDGSAAVEPVPIEGDDEINPNSFSADGTQLLVTLDEVSQERRSDIALIPWGKPGPPQIVLGSAADESNAKFAPDGAHFAFVSNETGRYEVFVRSLSNSGSKWQVSQAGGHEPVWSRDGRKLFFLDHKGILLAASVDWDSGPKFSAPEKLFDTAGIATTDLWGVYDVLPDGDFVMVQPAAWEKQAPRIHVVLNWREELKKR